MSLFDHMNLLADVGPNHRGDLNTFMLLCAQIEEAGALPKLQLYNENTFPRAWAKHLLTINFVPSVFRPEDVDFILPYKPKALKVASVESTFQELIARCLQEELPLIISTGGMDEEEIETLLYAAGDHPQLCLMHCVSLYPTPKESINLGRLARLSEDCDCTIGWSSHYPIPDCAAFALAWGWGATQFEVHVRPSQSEGRTELSLDEQCAFTPYGLKQIRSILEDLPILEGSDDYAGPDREFVLKHRGRWLR